jgi:hypothetical protein
MARRVVDAWTELVDGGGAAGGGKGRRRPRG